MSVVTRALSFRWANHLSQLSGYLSGVALLVATIATLHGVVSRYFLGQPTLWQTELSIYLLMFVTFVGGAYGLKHHAHVGVDLVALRLPARRQLIMRVVTAVASLFVVLVLVWTAGQSWWEAVEHGHRSFSAWRAPLSIVYAILPLGMLLVALQYVAFVIEGIQALVRGGPEDVRRTGLMQAQSPELASEGVVRDSDQKGTRSVSTRTGE